MRSNSLRCERSTIPASMKMTSQNMEPYQCIELVNMENVALIKFKDEKMTDPARIEQLGIELLTLVDDESGQALEIDFDNVRFFSSAAINKLIVLEKRVRSRGGKLKLSNLRPEVRDLFTYTKLDSVFHIEENEAESS